MDMVSGRHERFIHLIALSHFKLSTQFRKVGSSEQMVMRTYASSHESIDTVERGHRP